MKKIQNLIDNFSGELYNACYDFLQQGEKDSEAFEYVCKNFKEEPKDGTIKVTDYFSKEEIEQYESLYGETVDGLLDSAVKKCNFGLIQPEDFYKALWESYSKNFDTEKERVFAFYYTIIDKAIPYCYLGKPLSMSNERFKELIKRNETNIEKLKYIERSKYSQKTERASLVLNILDSIPEYEDRVVVLAHAITILGTKKAKSLCRKN